VYRRLSRLLRDAGCRIERQGKGSHEIWYSPVTGRTFSVPRTIKKTTTANGILAQAGLPKAF
jgi:hypothetical protein